MPRVIYFILSILIVVPAFAETPSNNPPKISEFSDTNPPLTGKERTGVNFGKEWANNRDKPARGNDGGIVFVFGSTLPTIVCAPLYVCDLALQEGEAVNDLNVGDSVRWKITPASQGTGDAAITHVMIKPTDVGLITNLVITTNRRTYSIKLLSRAQDWMPKVSFDYTDDVTGQWKAYRVRAEQRREEALAAMPVVAKIENIEFSISGDSPPWRPIKVYSDGIKTYIVFPNSVGSGELPAPVAIADDPSFLQLDSLINGPTTQLVNYRFTDHRFEVDKVLERGRLVSGVGDQQIVVTVTRQRKE